MAEIVVVNTGPLIALDRAGALDLPGRLPMRFVCPPQVREELDAGAAAGHPDIRPGWLSVSASRPRPSPAILALLDEAEAAVILLALEVTANGACIDEWRGRRVARASGLAVMGSLGLLGLAKKIGLVPRVRPLVERAVAAGIRYHPSLVESVLAELDELDP